MISRHPTANVNVELEEVYLYPGESLLLHFVERSEDGKCTTRDVIARVTLAGEAEVFPEVDGVSCLGDNRKLFA